MFVCTRCIEDTALATFIEEHLVSNECEYCGATSDILVAAYLEEVLEFMDEKISEEYDDPVDGMTYISAEGGWQGEVFEGAEIFDEIDFSIEDQDLFREIEAHFSGRLFCQRNHRFLTPSDRILSAWERFKQVVKHERRYTFWTSHDDGEEEWHPDHLPPSHMMSEIAQIIHKVSPLAVLPKGTEIWRARVHESESTLNLASEFTSPPVDQARQPNRMSPAGIPMFYGCADQETAYAETVDEERLDGRSASCACFAAVESLNLLDLTSIPTADSFFAVDRDTRHAIRFLKEFAADLAQPIVRDGRQHIDYVPTQVWTEYVRYELRTSDGFPFHGIIYQSSKNDGVCYVIFATQEECLPPSRSDRRQLLGFVEGSIQLLMSHESIVGGASNQ